MLTAVNQGKVFSIKPILQSTKIQKPNAGEYKRKHWSSGPDLNPSQVYCVKASGIAQGIVPLHQ
jgi:hypothetical protein